MNTYTCAYISDKTIGEIVHWSHDGKRSLCGRDMTSTKRRTWRQRNEVKHLKACKVCAAYVARREAA